MLLATQLGGVLTIAQILAAIVLTEGHVSRDQVRADVRHGHRRSRSPARRWRSSAAILWIERPEAAPLLLIPIVIAFLGYRAYVKERQGHEKVKILYEANRTLSESPEVAVALEGLLERALEAFHAEQAEVILFAADGGVPLRTGLGPGTDPRGDGAGRRRRRRGPARLRRGLRRRGRADRAVPARRSTPTSQSAASATACSACCAARIA